MRSADVMARARDLFPGGVNSPVRAFRGVGGDPVVAERGEGARIWDVDGREYLDFVLSWGPLVLGHAPPIVLDALERTMASGTSFGMPTLLEVELAEKIRARMPHVEMLRFVSSGTEATMSAVRLARAFTGRDAILKFEGCYHGHADSFLVRAGSGVATLGLPDSPGVPAALAALTLTTPFNDLGGAESAMRANEGSVAAIIVEPVVGNAGFIPPDEGFLEGLRALADEFGTLLIFDEVMTGFRIAPGGARERFGVSADLTTLGKVIGGGLPVAAYGGRRDIMGQVAPSGPVYQAGTLS
nr:glutamate-1-semialdehyde 2,1-aminomutase [Gemmatimonadaceae bacterium]